MKCPKCLEEGKKSIVTEGATLTNATARLAIKFFKEGILKHE